MRGCAFKRGERWEVGKWREKGVNEGSGAAHVLG